MPDTPGRSHVCDTLSELPVGCFPPVGHTIVFSQCPWNTREGCCHLTDGGSDCPTCAAWPHCHDLSRLLPCCTGDSCVLGFRGDPALSCWPLLTEGSPFTNLGFPPPRLFPLPLLNLLKPSFSRGRLCDPRATQWSGCPQLAQLGSSRNGTEARSGSGILQRDFSRVLASCLLLESRVTTTSAKTCLENSELSRLGVWFLLS